MNRASPEKKAKGEYLKAHEETGEQHQCCWPGCQIPVWVGKIACKVHWFRLPKGIRDRIWAAFVPGQEITGDVSLYYVAAVKEAQDWIAQKTAAKEPT